MRDLNKIYLKSRSINEESLLQFGFINNNEKYFYQKDSKNDDFSIVIEINNESAFSKVLDKFDGAEYALVDVEDSSGKFVGDIKAEYENILEKFVEKCTYPDAFKSSAAKKIVKHVKDNFAGNLEFLWDDYDGAVFRNNDNKKWYGVIMKVKEQSFVTSTLKRMKASGILSNYSLLNKTDFSDENYLELIDIHIDKNRSKDLVDYEKIFPGYHMNKDSWITIILDKNTDLKMVYNLLQDSYNMTAKSGAFIVPSNISIFDVISYVENNSHFVWYKQPKDAKVGDLVYIYVGAPYSQILYKCQITRANLKVYSNRDMELVLLKKYNNNEYTYGFLKEHGCSFIRTPRSIPESVAKLLK